MGLVIVRHRTHRSGRLYRVKRLGTRRDGAGGAAGPAVRGVGLGKVAAVGMAVVMGTMVMF